MKEEIFLWRNLIEKLFTDKRNNDIFDRYGHCVETNN